MNRYVVRGFCLVACMMVGLAVMAQAGNDEWTGGGPWTSRCLKYIGVNTLHPDTIYALGYNEVEEGDSLI